jgi:hypothetical protein
MNITKTFETATDLTSFEMGELLDIDQTSPDCMGIGLAVQTLDRLRERGLLNVWYWSPYEQKYLKRSAYPLPEDLTEEDY